MSYILQLFLSHRKALVCGVCDTDETSKKDKADKDCKKNYQFS